MAQINPHNTPELEQQLGLLMRLKDSPSKSEAIRMAVAAQAKAAPMGQRRHRFGSAPR
ncbi:MAG: hypothetical protein AB7F83_06515 [Lysobacterales bacterium]